MIKRRGLCNSDLSKVKVNGVKFSITNNKCVSILFFYGGRLRNRKLTTNSMRKAEVEI